MIGVLVFPDFQLLDAAGPISVFEIGARFAENAPAIRVVAVTPGPVRSSSGVEMLARGLKPSGAITTLIVAGGEGVRQAATCEKTLGFRARDCQAWRPHRQRLLRRLYPRRGRPARRPPRHHALAAHAAFSESLSAGEAGAGPHLRPRRRHLDLGRDIGRHRSVAGDDRGRLRRRDRAENRASNWCSIIAAAAASRNSPRCWN